MQAILVFKLRRSFKNDLISLIRKVFAKRIRPPFHDLKKLRKIVKANKYNSINNKKTFMRILEKMIRSQTLDTDQTNLRRKNPLTNTYSLSD